MGYSKNPFNSPTGQKVVKEIFDFRFEDFELSGYDPAPHIKASVAI